MDLKDKKCIPCEVGGLPLEDEIASRLLKDVPNWLIKDKKLFRSFKFKDFKEAISFVNKVAAIAEEEGHHPDIEINYNIVKINLTTHAALGLTENDFILAAKVDLVNSF